MAKCHTSGQKTKKEEQADIQAKEKTAHQNDNAVREGTKDKTEIKKNNQEKKKSRTDMTKTSRKKGRVLKRFEYMPQIPMPKEHQQYLYQMSKKRGIDYKKALAIIKHESNFNPSAISPTDDYGYFQINKVNHEYLAKKLNTPLKPTDPYVNINWGTYMLSQIYDKYERKGYKGKQLDEIVWSVYNRGERGYQENGIATEYVNGVRKALKTLP